MWTPTSSFFDVAQRSYPNLSADQPVVAASGKFKELHTAVIHTHALPLGGRDRELRRNSLRAGRHDAGVGIARDGS